MEAMVLETNFWLQTHIIGALLVLTMLDPTKPSGSSDKLEDALIRLTNQQLSLGESMNYMTHKIDELLHRVSPLLSTAPPIPSSISRSSPVLALNHKVKLDVSHFDGTDPLGWIFKINQFFEYHGTSKHNRLMIASFYIKSRALDWTRHPRTLTQVIQTPK